MTETTLDTFDDVKLPTIAKPAAVAATPRPVTDHANQLHRMTKRALERLEELLDLKPDPGSESYTQELRTLLLTCDKVINAQLRVDENQLRKQAADTLPRILDAIRRVEQGLPPQAIDNAVVDAP